MAYYYQQSQFQQPADFAYQQQQPAAFDPYAAQPQLQQQYYQQPTASSYDYYNNQQPQQQQFTYHIPDGDVVTSVQQMQMVYDPVSGQFVQQQADSPHGNNEQQRAPSLPAFGSGQAATLNAADAAAFVRGEREAEGTAGGGSVDPAQAMAQLQTIANKWNVGKSPTRPRKVSLARGETEEGAVGSAQQQQEQQQSATVAGAEAVRKSIRPQENQQQSGRQGGDASATTASVSAAVEEDDDGKSLIFSGSIEDAPSLRLRFGRFRAENIIAPSRGSGFDRLRSNDRPLPPTADSLAASAAAFDAIADAFRADTLALSGGKDADDVEIAEINHRERYHDEVAALRNELIREGQSVLQAHERLKRESRDAEQATQLVAHRQAPMRKTPPMPKGPELNKALLRGNSSVRSVSAGTSTTAGNKQFKRVDSTGSSVSRTSAARPTAASAARSTPSAAAAAPTPTASAAASTPHATAAAAKK